MRSERISKDISSDIAKMEKLLGTITDDRDQYRAFTQNPRTALRKYGIDFERYGTERLPADAILNDVVTLVRHMVDRTFVDMFREIIQGVVMKTHVHEDTNQGAEYNWDNSTHSEWRFEIHTDTERGVAAESTTHSSTETTEHFAIHGGSIEELEQILSGPLISEGAIKTILSQMELSLKSAKEMSTTVG